MSSCTSPGSLTPRDHVAGILLLVIACSTLALIPHLPARGEAGLELPFLTNVEQQVVVAFAGYPGCGTVCPASLGLLSNVYRDRAIDQAALGVLFINIQRDMPHAITDSYARAFHPDFRSYTVRSDDADAIYRSLSLQTFDDSGQAVRHSGYIYLFVRQQDAWRIEKVYRRTPELERLSGDLREFLNTA